MTKRPHLYLVPKVSQSDSKTEESDLEESGQAAEECSFS